MIQVFCLFTLVEGSGEDARPHLWKFLEMCKGFQINDGGLAIGKNNPRQFVVYGQFDSKTDWEKLDERLRTCEVEGDCFNDLMPYLEKPPKFYSFEVLEE